LADIDLTGGVGIAERRGITNSLRLKTDSATSLTVKWPMPLSKSFTERHVIENLIQRFVEVEPATP
jgi:hypothetical protein